jgi:Uri superfamily endonuclease
VNVGALGRLTFKKGLYAYVGSAQNNLEQRIKRHLGKTKRRFWHVDYLLSNKVARVIEVFHEQADKAEECAVARIISERGELIEGFGSSDCRCKSHLFRIEDYGFLQEFMRVLNVKTQQLSIENREEFSAHSGSGPVSSSQNFFMNCLTSLLYLFQGLFQLKFMCCFLQISGVALVLFNKHVANLHKMNGDSRASQ